MTTNPPSIAKSAATDTVNADSDTTKSDQTDKVISFKWLFVVLGSAALSLIAFYYFNFGYRLELGFGSQADFGAFGDFLGGVLNPILGFATVGLLIWSLKMQRDELTLSRQELTLTRQELKETKEETALSRQAMQDQVEHLQKEAKLNELVRLLNDLKTRINELLSEPLINDRYQMTSESFFIIAKSISTYRGILNKQLITQKPVEYWYMRRAQRESPTNFHNTQSNPFQKNYLIWAELERLVICFSDLVIKYNAISPSDEFKSVYIYEAHNFLAPLCETLRSQPLIDAMHKLGFDFIPEPEPEPSF